MRLILNLLIRTIAVLAAAYIIPGVTVVDYQTAIIIAIVLGVLNTFVKPVITFLTLPLTILTLGLFTFVVNLLMLYIAVWLIPGFGIQSILSAIGFGITISLINSFLSKLSK